MSTYRKQTCECGRIYLDNAFESLDGQYVTDESGLSGGLSVEGVDCYRCKIRANVAMQHEQMAQAEAASQRRKASMSTSEYADWLSRNRDPLNED